MHSSSLSATQQRQPARPCRADRKLGICGSLPRSTGWCERAVFQIRPCPSMTLLDVRDAQEVCSVVASPEQRSQCYAVFGVDGEQVDRYYQTVLAMEESIAAVEEQSQDPDEYLR